MNDYMPETPEESIAYVEGMRKLIQLALVALNNIEVKFLDDTSMNDDAIARAMKRGAIVMNEKMRDTFQQILFDIDKVSE